MPTIWGRNWQLQELELEYGKLYEDVLDILGSTGTILPLGDPKHGQPNSPTFTSVGEEQVTFTWSEAPSAFDTALDLTSPDSFQGIIPVVSFNGTDEEADSPDAAYWSRGDGTNDSPVSIGAWGNLAVLAENEFLSKYSNGAGREWEVGCSGSGGILRYAVKDESAGAAANRDTDAAAFVVGRWAFVVITYDGAGGASAMDTVTLYVDGSSVASTAANNASYVAMENGTGTVNIAHDKGTGGNTARRFWDGKMAGGPLGPFFVQAELTADAVRRLYEVGRRALGL
jgi:hypothetical protein